MSRWTQRLSLAGIFLLEVVFSAPAIAGTAELLLPTLLDNMYSCRNLVLNIVLALANKPAARILPSRRSNKTLLHDLGILYSRVDAGQVDSTLSILLVEQVIGNELDATIWSNADVWHAMFKLVARANLTMPVATFAKAAFDTLL